MKVSNKLVLQASILACSMVNLPVAFAEEAAPAAVVAAAPAEAAPPYTLSFNLGTYSNYMFRGVAISDGPALQGGIDFAHSSGFYAGTWFSNIEANLNYGNHLETDWYAGYAYTFANGIGLNAMGNYYWYPDGNRTLINKKEDAFEASIGVSYKWLTYTYFDVLTDYYGAAPNSKNAKYHELKAAYKLPVGDLNLLVKVGYADIPKTAGNASQGDYTIALSRDFSLPGASKPIEGFNAGAMLTDTFNVKDQGYYVSGDRDTNERQLTFYIKRTW
jgi:uncharacterized protein (TIGR02001 family)